MEERTCCVTGHRKIPEERREYVYGELRREIAQAITDGYTCFISGFDDGVNLMFAAIIAELKEQNDKLFLEAAIPYRNRAKAPGLQKLLLSCNGIYIQSEEYKPNCFLNRNRSMVSRSSRVIAVYDGRESGGTLFTMRYANSQEKDVRVIRL